MQTKHLIQSAEKRASSRSGVDLPVALSHFHTGCPYGSMQVKTCNQSVLGLCIISPYELSKEMAVFIRALKCTSEAKQSEPLFKSSALGEARWCRRIENQEGERYLAGIRYF
jgi:hypothetical protein